MLELTEATSGLPVLVNTDHVAHWFPQGESETLAEYGHQVSDPETGVIEARTIVVAESYPQIREALRARQPNAFVSLRKTVMRKRR